MRTDVIDMTGARIGTHVVIGYAGEKRWAIRCDCGREMAVAGARMRQSIRGEHRTECRTEAHAEARFFAMVASAGVGSCWIWTGHLTEDGYGRFKPTGLRSTVLAHKWLYERRHGGVPSGLELDHLCRNRACVNPAHQQPVTHVENVRRGNMIGIVKQRGYAV